MYNKITMIIRRNPKRIITKLDYSIRKKITPSGTYRQMDENKKC